MKRYLEDAKRALDDGRQLAVGAVIEDAESYLVIRRMRDRTNLNLPNMPIYVLPGGPIREDADPVQALVEKVKAKVNLDGRIKRYVGAFDFKTEKGVERTQLNFVFEPERVDGELPIMTKKGRSHRWAHKSGLQAYNPNSNYPLISPRLRGILLSV